MSFPSKGREASSSSTHINWAAHGRNFYDAKEDEDEDEDDDEDEEEAEAEAEAEAEEEEEERERKRGREEERKREERREKREERREKRRKNDNDTMTHSSKVFQKWSEAWPHGHERRGPNPAKKNLMRLVRLALIARCVIGTLLTTVCSHVSRERKKGKLVTQAIAETNSNEFR